MDDRLDFIVYVENFQPFRKADEEAIQECLDRSRNVVVVCTGADKPRSLRNPWTIDERRDLIRSVFPDSEKTISVIPMLDSPYNQEAWIWSLQKKVRDVVRASTSSEREPKVGIAIADEETKINYATAFPQWEQVPLDHNSELKASTLREMTFDSDKGIEAILPHLSSKSLKFYESFQKSEQFEKLREERKFLDLYKSGWKNAPYAPIFITTDAVVIQSGHILIVKRKANPGKDLLALPGGFLYQDETILEGCLRELRTETRLKVPEPVLRGSIKAKKVYDDPNRSLRGRTITHVFYFELTQDANLPKVKGGDDAKKAFWLPLSQLDSSQLFEDHFSIIQDILGMQMT
ncbi:MAG: bifunctional nicotinamide-nucleotide adenylyltransferase/Nudix hydroxylase [Alphaproteobacteria bacterium]|jgi:bifunctional NMN adenylyltransferase/nudix hydrolase|nr:bifunctional nicotinamide-nucleotide adenylyltransferase/Nudix hydroxylase [Alphaproteobacteria bacterium]MBT5390416.1 bifunctional nicotinamide-nucleotide adenylyltransferase/Nudix hydroxylase [Alphaproteobacteria bacterium]